MTQISALRQQLARRLYGALRERHTIAPLTNDHPELTIEDAYHISLNALELRKGDGERIIGKKIGVTSKAVQDMLGVHQPDFGFLTNWMQVQNGGNVSMAEYKLIQPRAEGEIAFILKEDLTGPGISARDVLDATEFVVPCFEIVDSRIDNWQIKIQDTIADNASCGVFALGDARIDPRSLDLAQVKLEVLKNGEPAGSGFGSAVQGHPCEAVAWLANTLGEFGIPFRRGEIILSGALAPLVPVSTGDHISLSLSGMGTSSLRFVA